MDDVAAPTERARSAKSTSAALVPEINCYLHLLMIIHLIDTERHQDVKRKKIIVIDDLNPRVLYISF